ncbi:hypothetical protein HOG00_02540 [bacterium]|jgi:hypothetical protein|nr:hypothetical protein [bacterium]
MGIKFETKKFLYIYGYQENQRSIFDVKDSDEFFYKLRTETPMGFFCTNHNELIERLRWLFVSKEEKINSEEELLYLMQRKGTLRIKEVLNEYA